MAVREWSTTAASNTDILSGITLDGSIMTVPQVDNAFRDMAAQIASQLGKMGYEGADIASAATTNLANASGWSLDITGTTTITAFGTVDAGQLFMLRFTGALTLTHNATSLILPGAANITTVAGDVAFMKSEGSGNWRCIAYLPTSFPPTRFVLTSQQTASGTSIDFTSIPSGVKRITVMFNGVSVDDVDTIIVQLGDSGGFETSGYNVTASTLTTGAGITTDSNAAGFIAATAQSTSSSISGSVKIDRINPSHRWIAAGVCCNAETPSMHVSTGNKATSAEVDRLRVTTTSAGTFDSGTINISYEF